MRPSWRVRLVALAEVAHEGLAALGAFQLGHSPGPRLGAEHAAHDVRTGQFDHGQGQVGDGNLHLLVQAEFVGDAHGAHHVLAEQYQHQNLGAAVGSLLERGAVVGQACAREGGTHTTVLAGVDGAGGLAQRALAGVAPV